MLLCLHFKYFIIHYLSRACYKFNIATVCVRIQSPQKCFISLDNFSDGSIKSVKYHQICIHCAAIASLKNMLRREVNKIHLLYKSTVFYTFIVWCIELSIFIIMNNDLQPASYFKWETSNQLCLALSMIHLNDYTFLH